MKKLCILDYGKKCSLERNEKRKEGKKKEKMERMKDAKRN